MQFRKSILFLSLIGFMVLSSSAFALQSGDFEYTVSGGNVTITRYTCPGAGGPAVIPPTIDNMPVVGIGDGAFYGCGGLTSVTIPGSVKSIGNGAFNLCFYLTSVTIGSSVISIGKEAFSDCSSLTSVTIPDSVTSIGDLAFSNCNALKSVTIGSSVTSIGVGAFIFCYPLSSVTIPNSVTSIRDNTFWGCYGLTSVTIPNSVTSIGKEAFVLCYTLTSVNIPNSVTSIGDNAFDTCTGLTRAYFYGNAPSMGQDVFHACSSNFTVCYTAGSTGFTTPTWDGYPAAQCAETISSTTTVPSTTTTMPSSTTSTTVIFKFIDNGDGTVTDVRTGLVWLKNAYPCEYKNWYDAVSYCSSLASGQAGLTDGSTAGQWRLPSLEELEGIGTDPPATWYTYPHVTWTMPGTPFTNVQSNWYWAGTSFGNGYSAWDLYMVDGSVIDSSKSSDSEFVWPVREPIEITTTTIPPATTTTTIPPSGYAPTDRPYVEYQYSNGNPIQSDSGGFFEFICVPPYTPWQYKAKVHIPSGYTGPAVCTLSFKFGYNTGDVYNPSIPVSDGDIITITLDSTKIDMNIPCWPDNQSGYLLADVSATFFDCSGNPIGWPNYTIQGLNINKKCCVPTAITLASFSAVPLSGKVIINWSTETEIDNAGFNIYRAETENGNYTKINTALISAKGSSTKGAAYEFVDTNVQNRKTYYYKLEDIDLSGKSTMHGPVSAMPRWIYSFK